MFITRDKISQTLSKCDFESQWVFAILKKATRPAIGAKKKKKQTNKQNNTKKTKQKNQEKKNRPMMGREEAGT